MNEAQLKESLKDEIISQFDILINDVFRRFRGEFYTPTIWVDEAHRMICQEFGPNWYEEYVVWDPAWGTGNLTRDYNFKELYGSTINESDLKIAEKYNKNAVKFQYDFLNDDVYPEGQLSAVDVDSKLERCAPGLVKAFRENRKIIIFMNPPYTGPGNNKRDGISKTNAGKTKINFNMLLSKIGYPSCQLHTQFLFRILELKKKFKSNNINICFFTTPLFLTGESYESFRKIFLDNFNYRNGFLFNAGHFSKVKENWGISFLLFRCQKGQGNNFLIKIKDENIIITDIGNKILYNTDLNINLTSWCKEKLVGSKEECIILSNPIQVKTWFEQKNNIATMYKDSLGFIGNSGNNLSDVPTYMSIYSVVQSLGFSITKDNFYRSISMFCAKSSIEINWINCKDEFCKPNENHLEFNQWVIDSIIYSIFHSCSQQSSLRNIIYKNKQLNIFNEFFWLSNQYMQDLANKYNFTELYQDAKIFNKDRFVYNELQKVLPQLSPDAIVVLNKANELVEKSFIERKNLFNIHPEWHLEAWDAGWYQIKLVLKELFPEDLKEFRLLYRAFEDRMREGVYKFGFLK